MIWLTYLSIVVLSYLIGSIPVGLILGKLLKGIDIRQYGSGKIGATNVQRTLGWGSGLFVLLSDVAKGLLSVLLARLLLSAAGPAIEMGEVMAALAAIVGHNWSLYIKGYGGRGVATALGGLVIISPLTCAIAFPLAILSIIVSDMSSVGSLGGTAAALVILLILTVLGYQPPAYAIFAVVAAGLIFFQHRDNIQRILAGRERRIGVRTKLVTLVHKPPQL
ncbi:MAG: glycerol-3-phosphate 1-O-acyltransferase PlsY [Chloroflexi bacterium]|nr:glycerol-3-phosphate 1-O-acyltransferase PlsY [Chloroflexota bacterium]MCL5075458.1 glycerol-3-phosphate 1-O-acyltransferase PlsY [Chloroflexota bacterium]